LTSPGGSTTGGRINDGVTVRKDSSFCLTNVACRRHHPHERTTGKKVTLDGISRQEIKQSWLSVKMACSGVPTQKK
jgi:hypothetical protein